MREVIKLYKKIGETPLECLHRFRDENKGYESLKMTYLGRLDPMAEGLLPVLVGDTRKKDDYLMLDKSYEFEVLWGFNTDTFDILGIISSVDNPFALYEGKGLESKVESILKKIRKKKTQKYPPYSSRTMEGRPLWQWARDKKITEIDIPERTIKIFSLEHIHTRSLLGEELLRQIETRINLVNGDFRQKKILSKWRKELEQKLSEHFLVSRFEADVSSGTYIRSLVNEMGELLGSGALTFSIRRTRVGDFILNSSSLP